MSDQSQSQSQPTPSAPRFRVEDIFRVASKSHAVLTFKDDTLVSYSPVDGTGSADRARTMARAKAEAMREMGADVDLSCISTPIEREAKK